MAIQMTRAEYEAKYGKPPVVQPTTQPIRMTRAEYEAKYAKKPTQSSQKSFGAKAVDTILGAGTAISNFIGGKAIADTFGAELAKIGKSNQEKQFISQSQPTVKQTIGSGLQVGSNLIPGAGIGAKLATKVAIGTGIGYLSDVGGKLQDGKNVTNSVVPGFGTAAGAVLPILGKITGLANTSQFTKNIANKLEEINLRLSPTEKQNLMKQGKQIGDYLASKKIVGTPIQRYAKIDGIYNDFERKITRVIDGSGVVIPKNEIIAEISKIPSKYTNNLSEFDSVVSKVEKVINTLKQNAGDSISASRINSFKRNEWSNAYSKNNTDVINDVSNEIGHALKSILDKKVKGLDTLNNEYSKIITAKRALFKAQTRNQAGIISRAIGATVGGSAGSVVPGVGTAIGAYAGDIAAKNLSTPVRSGAGASSQVLSEIINKIPVDKRGKLLIGRKALINLIQGLNN